MNEIEKALDVLDKARVPYVVYVPEDDYTIFGAATMLHKMLLLHHLALDAAALAETKGHRPTAQTCREIVAGIGRTLAMELPDDYYEPTMSEIDADIKRLILVQGGADPNT